MNQAPQPRFFLHRPIHEPSSLTQITSSPADPRTKLPDLDHFFTGRSTNQAPATHILSSLANPRTKLHDPDPFFTNQSTNQTPQASIYLSGGLSMWVCLCVSVFLCRFVCGCVCVHLRKRRLGAEVIVHREEREKLVRTEMYKIINTHATVAV